MYRKCKPVKDKALYDQYILDRPWCQFCGVPMAKASYAPHCGGVGLSRHHICRFGRSDEGCNLIVGCARDHSLCEGLLIRNTATGVLYPKLTLGIVLSVKKLRDPDLFDAERLAELYGRALPDLEPIPQFLIDDWAKRQASASMVVAER